MDVSTWWLVIVSILVGAGALVGGLNSSLLSSINIRLERLENRHELKVSCEACARIRYDCLQLRQAKWDESDKEFECIWTEFGKHSHTGLPVESKVTR